MSYTNYMTALQTAPLHLVWTLLSSPTTLSIHSQHRNIPAPLHITIVTASSILQIWPTPHQPHHQLKWKCPPTACTTIIPAHQPFIAATIQLHQLVHALHHLSQAPPEIATPCFSQTRIW